MTTPVRKDFIIPFDNIHMWTFDQTMDRAHLSARSGSHSLSELESIRSAAAAQNTLYLVDNVSPGDVHLLGSLFKCPFEVFNDHLQRAGDDVALLLPSQSRAQSHVVIPYRRVYEYGVHHGDRGRRNTRSTFCHGSLITTEEHVTIWISPPQNGSWTGMCNTHI